MAKKKTKKKQRKRGTGASTRIQTYDPLQSYLSKIGKYELLTPEEERSLTLKFYETKDPKAAYELTVKNLRLVVKIAMDYRRAWSNILDLIQEGNIGLMTAIQKFDPYRQTRLSTYASWWIKAYILKFIMSNWRLIKIGNTQAERKLFYNLKKEHEKLLAEGFVPGPKLLAKRLNVKEGDVIEMSKRLGTSELSLDRPQSFQKNGSQKEGSLLGDIIANDESPMDENLAREQLRAITQKATEAFRSTLKRRETLLLEQRILSDNPRTLQEIGDEWEVSRERVRQIEARLLEKMKLFFQENFPELKSNLEE